MSPERAIRSSGGGGRVGRNLGRLRLRSKGNTKLLSLLLLLLSSSLLLLLLVFSVFFSLSSGMHDM